jgi:hypothetical protein
MQGPYTVCKELPAKGASNAARTPNIEGRLKWGAKSGLGRAVRDGPIDASGVVGKYPPRRDDPQMGNQSVELLRPPLLKGATP